MPVRYLGPKPENVPSLQEVNTFEKGFTVYGNVGTTGTVQSLSPGEKSATTIVHYLNNTNTIQAGVENALKTGLQIDSTGSWSGTGNVNQGLLVNVAGGTTNYSAIFSGGNLGIGTSTPAYLLDVNGTTRISGQSYVENRLNVNNALNQIDFEISTAGVWAGAYTGLSINNTKSNGRNWFIRATADGATEAAGKLIVTDATASVVRLSIDSSGMFGVGLHSPSTRLHVQDASSGDYLQYSATLNGASALVQSGMTGCENTWIAGTTNSFNISVSATRTNLTVKPEAYMTFGTNDLERVRIASNGYVGVNTTTAKSRFQIDGSFGLKVTNITSNFTLTDIHSHVFTTGTITITLPDATTCAGRMYWIKSKTSTSSVIPHPGQQIDGAGANVGLSIVAPDCYTLISDGTGWWIV